MQKLISYLILILLLTSCEEQTSWDLQPGNNDFLVVDGIITSELKTQTISILRPVSNINESAQPVSGATILVSSNELVFAFHEDTLHPGIYKSDIPFQGIKNQTYSLLITFESRVYSAKTMMSGEINFSLIGYEKSGVENKFRMSKTQNNYSPTNPAMFEIQLDWSNVSGYANLNPDSCKAKLYYYVLPTLDVSEVFTPGIEKVSFPVGTLITERRFSLTSEHAAFIRAVLLETSWQGGFFNTATANVPTNLSSGAKGFFGACGVSELTDTVK